MKFLYHFKDEDVLELDNLKAPHNANNNNYQRSEVLPSFERQLTLADSIPSGGGGSIGIGQPEEESQTSIGHHDDNDEQHQPQQQHSLHDDKEHENGRSDADASNTNSNNPLFKVKQFLN